MNSRFSVPLRRAVLAVVLPATAAGALAACDDSPAPAPAPAAAPAPSTGVPAEEQHMISNGGHRLAFYVTPGHGPAIVLDAGGGEDHSQWKSIVPQLARATGAQIITYDRAGLGASDEVKGAWDVHAAVSDLQAGLMRLGVTKDVILVAHSQAGEVATYFVRKNPRLVSGAVLVDASLPQFSTDEQIARVVAATTPQIEALKQQPSTKQTRQLIATAANYGPMHHAYHKVSWPAGVPATVVVSEKTPFDGSPQDARHWRDAAAAFVASGPGRTLVTAVGSSHEIPQDRPQLVAEEIEKMVTARG
ncbi:alpha/beta fold hydrolase [Actinoplanes sp. N902-109]|uniref:alpha/beta fold hydrolase n=1 Tax=Actinoplanes sp. (strain N902-109) TaxID=649831 RepID=UPI0003294A31|nr:alpha/beta hydrolase [Actinoplanes sp. N902-109]AGL16604.1 putative beta-lactamase [Actinoplanes sp. N902-109]